MKTEQGVTSDKLFLVIALILVTMGFGYAYLTAPTRLTVAVGPEGSPDEKLLSAFAAQLKQQRVGIRLKILPVADVRAAGEALEAKKVQLAVVRPDVSLPENGLTLAILRDAPGIVIAPASAELENIGSLAGKTLGVVTVHENDPKLIDEILSHYELGQPAVTLVPITHETAITALKEGGVDAVALIAPPAGTLTTGFVRGLAAAFDGKISVLSIENSEGLTQRSPAISAMTIPEGVWGGRPPRPDKEVKTVGVNYRLMARNDIDRQTVSLVVESLFQMRSRLAMSARSALFMRAPETETATSATSASLPNHPGAVDYFQREQQTFMDRYGDWVYLSAFFGSGLASAGAAFQQRFRRRRREVIDDVLDRLIAILAEARAAETQEALEELAGEIDELLSVAVTHARSGAAGNRTTNALSLAIDGARTAIEDRRRHLRRDAAETRRGSRRLVTVS